MIVNVTEEDRLQETKLQEVVKSKAQAQLLQSSWLENQQLTARLEKLEARLLQVEHPSEAYKIILAALLEGS